ncbi:MAG: phosphotransferase family protein, partial [Polyangia bacterium]
WREVGGQLAALHTVARCDDPLGVLHTRNKRDARPYLHALAPALAQRFARWLDRLESVPAAAPRLLHYDVHGLNVLCAPAGVTLIDWGDAGWGDPASELGSVPMRYVPEVLAGYEERASLGPAAEARILRAVLGHAVRKLAERGRTHPLDQLLAFVERGAPERWREWIVDQ